MFESLKSPEGNLPTLYNLHRFGVVVERASLVKAARELGVDPSNLKKEIVKLEDSLGFQLVRKQGDHMVTTRKGRELYKMLFLCSNSLKGLVNDSKELPEILTIGGDSTTIQWIIDPRISRIRELLNGVKLSLKDRNYREIIGGLWDGSLDFAISDGGRILECYGLQATPLDPIEYALYVPNNLQLGADPNPDRLSSIPFAGLDPDCTYTQRLDEAAELAGYKLSFESFYGRMGDLYHSLNIGNHAAVLPTIAHAVQPLEGVEIHTSPAFLKDLAYTPALVWLENSEHVRPWLEKTASTLHKGLTLPLEGQAK